MLKPSSSTREYFPSTRLIRRLRQASGLILALFISMHLGNHALGLFSVETMEAARRLVHAPLWQSLAGKALLIIALTLHFLLALLALYKRSTLRMPLWEAAQMAFGFAIPLMLVGHIVGTQIAPLVIGYDISYPIVLNAIWSDDWIRIKQAMLVMIVWVHACIGIHFWLRLYRWYRRYVTIFYAMAVLLPVLAIVGFIRASLDVQNLLLDPVISAELMAGPLNATISQREWLGLISRLSPWVLLMMVFLALLAREFRLWLARRHPQFKIHHPTAGILKGMQGQSVLEVLRAARVPHASICGGRARCTTCRINIDRSDQALDPPVSIEASALKRIKVDSSVRLACQVRPQSDIWITPLMPPRIGSTDYQDDRGITGNEQEVVAMFVDLRGFSSYAETRLPYDVVLVLNQFMEHMSAALESTRGHYAQFTGDGLFALFGLQGGIRQACRDALSSAVEMQRRLDSLNQHIHNEIEAPLKIGIGIHCGEAIVGPMGPPNSRLVSAIGDSVNVASRLEATSKQFSCIAVVSRDTIERAGLSLQGVESENIEIRGRQQKLTVYPIYDIDSLEVCVETGAG